MTPSDPPKVALQVMAKANKSLAEGRYVHTIPGEPEVDSTVSPSKSAGYQPHRQTARRRPR